MFLHFRFTFHQGQINFFNFSFCKKLVHAGQRFGGSGQNNQSAHRLIEAHNRGFWTPDAETRDALDRAEEELEDRLEGVTAGVAA